MVLALASLSVHVERFILVFIVGVLLVFSHVVEDVLSALSLRGVGISIGTTEFRVWSWISSARSALLWVVARIVTPFSGHSRDGICIHVNIINIDHPTIFNPWCSWLWLRIVHERLLLILVMILWLLLCSLYRRYIWYWTLIYWQHRISLNLTLINLKLTLPLWINYFALIYTLIDTLVSKSPLVHKIFIFQLLRVQWLLLDIFNLTLDCYRGLWLDAHVVIWDLNMI